MKSFLKKIIYRFKSKHPFGRVVRGSYEDYQKLWYNAKNKSYPEIDKYEKSSGFSIDIKWFHKLALHTQIVIKKSELCYQHGRVIYSTLSNYIYVNNNENINIVEIGTARGFSTIIMARALMDYNQLGKIMTIDPLPHSKRILWNCIDDNSGPKTRLELLKDHKNLIDDSISFLEGISKNILPKLKLKRIHFAFIDGAHDYDNVMYESKFISKFQNAGDIIIFDDYNKSQYPSLVEAVDEFCKNELYSKIIINGNHNRNYVIATKE